MELDFDKYKAQQFCDNADCAYYAKVGEDNIRTHSRLHHQGCDRSPSEVLGRYWYLDSLWHVDQDDTFSIRI